VIAIDTNILIYAHVPSFTQHAAALRALEKLVHSGAAWAVPWPCAHEFCAVITNPKWRSDAIDAAQAVAILRSWESAPIQRPRRKTASFMTAALSECLRETGKLT
jgi:uncharacterized protein